MDIVGLSELKPIHVEIVKDFMQYGVDYCAKKYNCTKQNIYVIKDNYQKYMELKGKFFIIERKYYLILKRNGIDTKEQLITALENNLLQGKKGIGKETIQYLKNAIERG